MITYQTALVALVLDLDAWLPTSPGFERPMFHVVLDFGVIELASN